MSLSFNDLNLSNELLRAVQKQGYTSPTPIQQQVIPAILNKQDVMGTAQTGTGKTAGFTLPLLQRLMEDKKNHQGRCHIRALIITPTRELAAQVCQSVEVYGRYLPLRKAVVFGGVNMQSQIHQLRSGVDILVATPGRLLDHVRHRTVDLSRVDVLILDEADHMLDMGFLPDVKKILALLPRQRQNLMFSATFSDEIKKLAMGLLSNPVVIKVVEQNTASELVNQVVHHVDRRDKKNLLSHIIGSQNWQRVLVFTRTKHGANRLSEQLAQDGISSIAIHGNKSQAARTKALSLFKKEAVRVLVATDVAARGLDIQHLPHVVNFDLPPVAQDYIHRIGRTGRAGNQGEALSLVSSDEMSSLRNIERTLRITIPKIKVQGYKINSDTPDNERTRESVREKPFARRGQNRFRGRADRFRSTEMRG